MTEGTGGLLYRVAVATAIVFALAHFIALPISISVDGGQYIDMAEMLGSDRFPTEWHEGRTPLFPLLLKCSFGLFGRQPMAAGAVGIGLGLAGTLAAGEAIRRLAGPWPASASLLLLSAYPTLVAFEHFVLTESGTFCFLALTVWVLTWDASTGARRWRQAVALVLVLAGGYYLRQTLVSLSPLVAVLFGWNAWRHRPQRASAAAPKRRAATAALVQMLLVGAAPHLLALPWQRCVEESPFRDIVLCQGMIRQALLPPDHPYLGIDGPFYADAIERSRFEGHLYSGLRQDLLYQALVRIRPRIPMPFGKTFLELAWQYPFRYLSGVGRTLMLFAGAGGLESESENIRQCVLNPALLVDRNIICIEPTALRTHIHEDFSHPVKPSATMRFLWSATGTYGWLLRVSMICGGAGLLLGLVRRDLPLLILYGPPAAFLLLHAAFLASIDRFAVPGQPLFIAALAAMPVLAVRALKPSVQNIASV